MCLNIPLDATVDIISCSAAVRKRPTDPAGGGRRARIPAACAAHRHAGPGKAAGVKSAACWAARFAQMRP